MTIKKSKNPQEICYLEINHIRSENMPGKVKKVAVIGAGPAGAIAVDALAKEQAFDTIRVFERKSLLGGTWYVAIPSLHQRQYS